MWLDLAPLYSLLGRLRRLQLRVKTQRLIHEDRAATAKSQEPT